MDGAGGIAPTIERTPLARRIPEAILAALREFGAPAELLESERNAMAEARFDRTASRSLLGTMNDYITLFKLHGVLRTVMGWTDSHLRQFRADEKVYVRPAAPDTSELALTRFS